jgi:hypothetical protein
MQFSSNAIHVSYRDMQTADGIIRCAERDKCFHKKHIAYDPEYGEELPMHVRRELLRANTSWDTLYAMILCDMLYFEDRQHDRDAWKEAKRVALNAERNHASK